MATETSNKLNSTSMGKAEEHLFNISNTTGKRFGVMASDLADNASQQLKHGRDYVKDNPVKGVAIAAATGLVVGSLVTMVMRRK